MNAVGILLAAGRARRYGADKLLLPLADGTPVAVASARALLEGCGRAVAVLRPAQQELARLLRAEGLEVLERAEAERGMGASLACGVAGSAGADGWIVALADMPWLRPATVAAVAEALTGGASLCAPGFEGRRGHPVGFSARWRDDLVALDGDRGARDLLDARRAQLHLIACDDPGCLCDIDTPADLMQGGRLQKT